MTITKLILAYCITLIVFLTLDLAWLGYFAKDFYRKHLYSFLSEKVNKPAAFIFYLIFVIGIFIFALLPSIEKDSLWSSIKLGALFGFFTYATYDLTNLAILKNWPVKIVIIDIFWGTILTSSASAAGFFIVKYIQ